MFHRTTINLLFSIYFGLIILVADLAIYILSVFLYIFQDIRRWGTLQMRVISGQLRATLNRDNSRPRRLNGQSEIHQIGSNQNPFLSLSPEYFLHQTHPGSPRMDRARRRMRRETTPSRPSSSRAARRPRRLLAARPLSQTPPPTYSASTMLPEPGPIQEQTIGIAKMENVSTSKVEKQEAEEPLLSGQDQSQVELHSTPPSRRLSLAVTPPLSPPPTPSDQPEREL